MHKPNLVFVLIAVLVLALIGNKVSKSPNPNLYFTPKTATKSINMYPLGDNQPDYFGFNITAPYSYFATSDEMLVSYDSQGGMAPPRLILMKGYQVMGEYDYQQQILQNPSASCIAIWTTMGFNSVNDWNTVTGFTDFTKKEDLKLGNRTAQIYKTNSGHSDMYVGFLPIGDENDTSYLFTTCNDSNKKDLLDIMSSLKLRSDINFEVNSNQ